MSNQKSIPLGSFPEGLQSREAQLEPFDWFRTQRANGGIRYDESRQCYDVFDYETVKRVLSDYETFSSDPLTHPENTEENTSSVVTSMLYEDPPRHTELRSTVEDFFTPRAVAELAPDIEQMAHEFLDEALDGQTGQFDFVQAFSYPLPVTVIAGVLGIPEEDRDKFRDWSMRLIAASGPSSGDDGPDRAQRQMKLFGKLQEYFVDLLETRREDPRDDLISRVVGTGEFTTEEMLGFCYLLLIAGNVTTTTLLANAVWCLGQRNLIDELHGDQEALELAIEEILRYRSPTQAMQRWTTEPVTIGDYDLPKHSGVVVWIPSANRDEAAFDEPDAFVPDRQPNRHIAFGHGVHTCLGSSLARLEARVALEAVMDRFQTIEPILDEAVPSGSLMIYGPREFPIRYKLRS